MPGTEPEPIPASAGGWRSRLRRLWDQPMVRHLLLGLAAALGFLLLTSALSPYDDFQVAQVAVYALALAGLTVLTGANGQISLGHGAFMAVGAYTTAMLLVDEQVPLGLAVAASTATSALLGLIVGLPATRLRGPYLAGLTLALAVGLPQVSVRFAHVFGGEEGISVPPPTPPDGVDPQRWLAWICLLTTLVVLVLLANLMSSNVGRAFRSVRDDEVAAALAGIHVGRTKVLCFTVSAACAGLSGGLLGLGTAIVNPGEFAPALSIGLLAGMVLGGAGSLLGAWWGAVFLVYVPQWATSISSSLHLNSSISSNLALVVYGLVLIGVVMAAPAGIQGGLRRLVRAGARRLGRGDGAS